jgi:protein O-mannosyl-transferase
MGDQAKTYRRLVGGCLVAFAAILTYSNTFTNDFVWDDASSVLIHQDVQNPARIAELFTKDQHHYGRGQGNFYRPLVSVSFMIDYAISGGQGQNVSPFMFHLSNVLWHGAAAVLLLALLIRLGARDYAAICVALVYAVHPVHTEAVTYISGRADSMSAAFMFAALAFALWDTNVQTRLTGALLSGLLFICALLSKEAALIYAPLLALCIWAAPTIERRTTMEKFREHFVAVGLAISLTVAYAGLRATVLNFGSDSTPRAISFAERVGEVLGAFALYIKVIVWPSGLHMERVLDEQPLWQILLGLILLAGIIAWMLAAIRAKRIRTAAGLAWFLITWLPISGIFPLNAPMAEHWLYVPIAGLLWAVAELVWPLVRRGSARYAAAAALALVVFAFLATSINRNHDWRSNQAIYAATLEKNPDTIRVNYNLAVTYEDLVDNPAGARRHFERVIALYDQKRLSGEVPEDVYWIDDLDARVSLGRLHLNEMRYDLAARRFESVMHLSQGAPPPEIAGRAVLGIAICYLAAGQTQQAGNALQQLVQTDYLRPAAAYFAPAIAENRRVAEDLQRLILQLGALQNASNTQNAEAGEQPAAAPVP